MKRFFQHIILVLTLSVMAVCLNSCKPDGVIDEDDMAKIYAEMLMMDQWITYSPYNVRMIADTSLVYEPILRKYGYTAENYRKSLEYYLDDPETYADIMKETIKILDRRLASLNERKVIQEKERERNNYVKRFASSSKISESVLAINHIDTTSFGIHDSLSVAWDSLSCCFNIIRIPQKQVVDSLAVDSLIVDSLTVDDRAVVDSSNTKGLRDKFKKLDTTKTLKLEQLKVTDSLSQIDIVWE